jgi:hypothetical protein
MRAADVDEWQHVGKTTLQIGCASAPPRHAGVCRDVLTEY